MNRREDDGCRAGYVIGRVFGQGEDKTLRFISAPGGWVDFAGLARRFKSTGLGLLDAKRELAAMDNDGWVYELRWNPDRAFYHTRLDNVDGPMGEGEFKGYVIARTFSITGWWFLDDKDEWEQRIDKARMFRGQRDAETHRAGLEGFNVEVMEARWSEKNGWFFWRQDGSKPDDGDDGDDDDAPAWVGWKRFNEANRVQTNFYRGLHEGVMASLGIAAKDGITKDKVSSEDPAPYNSERHRAAGVSLKIKRVEFELRKNGEAVGTGQTDGVGLIEVWDSGVTVEGLVEWKRGES